MKIKQITLKKYKRFFDLTIDLGEKPKKIIALVGANDCGKSSIFDGMLYHFQSYHGVGENLSHIFNSERYHTNDLLSPARRENISNHRRL